jgi:hypothetical protein
MKQTILVLTGIVSITCAKGQVFNSFGVKLGASIANQTWQYKSIDEELDTENRTGFYSALTVDFFNSKYLNLTTDIAYCQKGHTIEVQNTTIDMPEGDGTYKTMDTRFDYIVLNPMLKVKYEANHFIPYALLGIRMDSQLSYKSDFDLQEIDGDIKKSLWGLNCGIGVEYKLNKFGVFIESQYLPDFSKVIDMPATTNNTGLEVTNKAFVVSLGLKY